MERKAISAERLFDGEEYHNNTALIWQGNTVEAIVPISQLPASIEHLHFSGGLICPGFIDLQVNGGGGVMFNNDITPEAIGTICQAHRSHGTAYLLPTLISSTPQNISQALQVVQQVLSNTQPGILGIHLEGPWLSKEKKGAHDAALFYSPTVEELSGFPWLSTGKVLVTAAIETMDSQALNWLKENGICIACGHSNATFEQLSKHNLDSVDGFTHLFNAMSPLEGRAPGVVGAALLADHTWCSIICDGIHVHPQSILLAYKAKPKGKLIIVTDAMATLGSKTNCYEMDGEVISLHNGKLVNSRGDLVGAHIGMAESVANVIRWGVPEQEALKMASTYPANALGTSKLGLLKPGYKASATILSQEYKTLDGLVDGNCAH